MFGEDRLICDVFEEMRECLKTKNFSYLEGLIEEGQSYANRMESAIQITDTDWEQQKVTRLKGRKNKYKKTIIKLEKKEQSLKDSIASLKKLGE
jgi:hypothetical protein